MGLLSEEHWTGSMNFTYCRMPLESNDYSDNDVPEDFGMNNLSIDRDRYIKNICNIPLCKQNRSAITAIVKRKLFNILHGKIGSLFFDRMLYNIAIFIDFILIRSIFTPKL